MDGLERFDPSLKLDIWLEHWHRYVFATPASIGRDVLDIACGEGYGAAFLAQHAKKIVGMDIDQDAINNARRIYTDAKNLSFVCADATAIPLPDQSKDLVVSFETLEHLQHQKRLISEFARVLKPSGVLLISTPDREIYSAPGSEANPHHVKELNKTEFLTLLGQHFPALRLWGQGLQTLSVIENMSAQNQPAAVQYMDAKQREIHAENADPPVYLIAACAADESALDKLELNARDAFNARDNALFQHQQTQIRRLIQQDHFVIGLQQKLRESEYQNAQLRSRLGY